MSQLPQNVPHPVELAVWMFWINGDSSPIFLGQETVEMTIYDIKVTCHVLVDSGSDVVSRVTGFCGGIVRLQCAGQDCHVGVSGLRSTCHAGKNLFVKVGRIVPWFISNLFQEIQFVNSLFSVH